MASDYDLIVIGSGMGGLTVASLMTQLRGKRVLVLEKHDHPGGYTHDFKRGRYHFDTGLHYLGMLHEGSMMRNLFDLILDGQVEWVPMPDPYDTFMYPDLRAHIYFDPRRTIAELCDLFPEEARAIQRYFKHIPRAAAGLAMRIQRRNGWGLMRAIAAVLRSVLRPSPTQTVKAYLDAHFRDPRLKAVLASQWGDYGLPPGLAPLGLHGMVVNFYSRGGYYPRGGSGVIGASARQIVERGGGTVLLRREVQRILIEKGKAVGVEARKVSARGAGEPEQYFAPAVVSNAGAAETYLGLIPEDQPIPFRDDIRRFLHDHPPTTNLALFLGLDRDPRELGCNGANLWIYDDLDHDATFARRADWLDGKSPGQAYVSFHSLKQPDAEAHAAEILAFTDYAPFARWRDQPWMKRDAEYQQLKQRIAASMLAQVERYVPGLTDSVQFQELGTPLSNEHFTCHTQGASYGITSVPERFDEANLTWTHPRTPVEGLFMSGQDVAGLGVSGAMIGGLMCVSHLPDRITMLDVRRAAKRKI